MNYDFYAIKPLNGDKNIVESWVKCESIIKEFKNTIYKGFKKKSDAEEWLSMEFPQEFNKEKLKSRVQIYIDGSFLEKVSEFGGWAWVAIQNGKLIGSAFGSTIEPALSRNIDGELEAASHAFKWWEINKKEDEPLDFIYDYEGIANFALKAWEAKSDIARKYQSVLDDLKDIQINFFSIESHKNRCKWNDLVDRLAKEGIYLRSDTSKSDLAEYFYR